jgi:ATP-binding cassette subfamily B protein
MIIRIIGLVKPYWMRILLASGTLIAGLVLRLCSPLVMRSIVDQVLIQKDTSALILLPLLIIFTLFPSVLYSLVNYLTAWIGQRIAAELRQKVFDNLLRQGMRFFEDARTGELVMDVIWQATEAILSETGLHLPELLKGVLTIVFSLVVMFILNARLAIVTLLVFPLFFLPIRELSAKGRRLGEQYLKRRSEMANLVQETISGIRLVVAMNRQSYRVDALRACNDWLVRLWAKLTVLDTLNEMWFTHILQAVGVATIFGVGSFAVLREELTIGGLVAFMTYTPWLYSAISTLPRTKLEWEKNRAALQRAFSYINLKSDIADGALTLKNVKGQIEFENVSFRYASRTESALHNINFCIKPGQFVALVGPSGSGKSTVVDLLVRFYDPISGIIRVDGKDIRNFTLDSLRRNIALVPQETFLFNDTVKANLLFGNELASEEEMIAAAKAAQIHDFIMTLPQGYNTILGERGVKISGGERQRISIARALLRGAPILVLDEATSFVDSITETELQKALNALLGKCTIIMIAHRLSTIVGADRIYVFDKGKIVEEGTHEELLRQGRNYTELYRAQLSSSKARL